MPYRVDNSRLAGVATCTTFAVLRYLLNLTSVEEKAPRHCGKVLHDALAKNFAGEDQSVVVDTFEKGYREFAEENVPPDDRLSFSNVMDILKTYLEKRPVEKLPFVPIKDGIEKVVSFPLDDNGEFEMNCKIDLPCREKEIGSLCVCDHKTTGHVTSWWAKQFRMSSQISGYIWCTAQAYGEVVPMVYINAIQLNKLPDASRKCAVHKVPYYECRKEHTKFELFTTQRSPEDLENWRRDAIRLARRLKVLEKAYPGVEYIEYAPMEGKFNGGCTFCEFQNFCFYQRRVELVDSMLVEDVWRPWEKEGEKENE